MTIDWWTLGIQTVNVVILVWLLGRFFWRPLAAMNRRRQGGFQPAQSEKTHHLRTASDKHSSASDFHH